MEYTYSAGFQIYNQHQLNWTIMITLSCSNGKPLYIEDPLQLPTSNYELHARQWSFTSQFPTVPIALVYGKKNTCSRDIAVPSVCLLPVSMQLNLFLA